MYCLHLYPPRRAWSAFISPQPDLAGILVVLCIIIFLSKVKLCKSCLSKCNWFVVWLRMTSEFFHPLSHPLRNVSKSCRLDLSFSKKCDHKWILFISVNHLILYSHRSTEWGVKSYSLLVFELYKYIEMSSESLSTIRDDWDVRFE